VKARSTVFSSQSEAELFEAIHGSWEPDYRVFPQIPFANLVELDQHQLSATELGFLHKTSVDYVVTSNDWRPVFVLEFDGLGHGYSAKGGYIQSVPFRRDPNRAWKLGLKTRVAQEASLPFLIVSYDEKAVVDHDSGLIVTHGIIGQFLASLHLSARIQELYDAEADALEAMPARERSEYVQDYVAIPAEVDTDLRWNPIAALEADLQTKALSADPSCRWSLIPLDDSPGPPNSDPFSDPFDSDALIEWWKRINRWGAQVSIATRAGTVSSGQIWVRALEAPGIRPLSLAWRVAGVIAWRKALNMLSQPRDQSGAA
jgi:uncharacterized protein DUF2726